MDTATAATKAGVTPATIRNWCRKNVVAATKTSGKWTIEEASLNRRISVTAAPAQATAISRVNGYYVAIGHPAAMEAALTAGTPIPVVDGKCAGDTIYLGMRGTTIADDAITLKTTGRISTFDDGTAAYAIDLNRLDAAPRLDAAYQAAMDAADRYQAEQDAADDSYSNPRYM